MADQERQPSRAEQRMLAVAKLKRAASLPRMKDGRRPPMHVEAVSEGEKPANDGERNGVEPDEGTKEPDKPSSDVENMASDGEKAITPEENSQIVIQEKADVAESPSPTDGHAEPTEAEADADVEERVVSPGPTSRSKRRSRSRSRSRGSKDLKGKVRALQTPPPGMNPGGDSSQDEGFPAPSYITLPVVTPLLSPTPSHFAALQNSRLLRSPTPASPELSLFYPGTSPPTPIPLPTLEAIQKGLARSSSAGSTAAGRRLAMHKLTRGTETYDPSPSPTPPPQSGKLWRNNTVSGGERTVARQILLSRLGGRITKEADAEQMNTEDMRSPSPGPKRRRRRSRKESSGAIPIVSDNEVISTSSNTPVVPPTLLPLVLDNNRARSATPNQANGSHKEIYDLFEEPPSLPVIRKPETEQERPEITRRRSVVVEDDDEDRYFPEPPNPKAPYRLVTHLTGSRPPHSSDAPSNISTDSNSTSAVGVPIYLSQRTQSKDELFPSSPFTTPLKEKPISDDDEEQVLYQADTYRPRTPYGLMADPYDREISWIASPVPEIRMPIHDDEDEETQNREQGEQDEEQDYDDAPLSATSSHGFSPIEDVSPRASSDSKSLVIESEILPERSPSLVPPSQTSLIAVSQNTLLTRASDDSASPQSYPARLSVASRIQSERSPINGDFPDWDERGLNNEPSLKRNGESTSPSTWEKVKNTFAKAGSNSGRRSRSNSIVNRDRRDHTDSSISRESGVSLTSTKTDRVDSSNPLSQFQNQQPLMQSPSASVSILSLGLHAPSRGGASPIPPASSADLSKYKNAKLFPFPGMRMLEDQRNRAKGIPNASSSTPDIVSLSNNPEEHRLSPSASAFSSSDINRERKLSHQASDTRLLIKYVQDSGLSPSPSSRDHFNLDNLGEQQNGGSLNLKLPMTLPGVKQWLSKNNKKKTSPSQGASPPSIASVSAAPVEPHQSSLLKKKPSLSDVLRGKDNDLGTDWEDIGSTPTSTSGDTLLGKKQAMSETPENDSSSSNARKNIHMDFNIGLDNSYASLHDSPTNLPSRSDPLLSSTPDPLSSLSDYPGPSTSESSSTTSSQYSLGGNIGSQGSIILERLDESLSRASRSPVWASAIDDPPRKLILSSPVLQVVNPNTVKDRFLFLFNDILVIAKPVIQDLDNLMDTYKPSPLDRKYVVKNVIQLSHLRFGPDRTEPQTKMSNHGKGLRSPFLASFVEQFTQDPDKAINILLSKNGMAYDSNLVGQLLFKTFDLDRATLGEYLSRRTSKSILKAYLDCFGFVGLRVDRALRVFLYSINIPPRSHHSWSPLDYLLDAFSSRWYEANAKIVAYDKDLAIRLVRALAQLNELLHGGFAQGAGHTGHPKHNVQVNDFLEAFRRYDVRHLVSDELLEEVYESVRQERLCQCRNSASNPVDIPIIIKRPLPSRLTYKVQSEPIILRIPQADPQLTIQLYGQDLVFEPPTLTFSKSSEVSFRVMGTSLGFKTMVMCRSGPNALNYSGLPLSNSLVVERAFMRNTFQLAFLNQKSLKRRYMFSVDDPLIRHQWAVSLKRQIENVTSASGGSGSPVASQFFKAAEVIAFKVLQDTLLGTTPNSYATNKSNGIAHNGRNDAQFVGNDRDISALSRSKSRSKFYHRLGAGKNEIDLALNKLNGEDDSPDMDEGNTGREDQHYDGILWSGRDLEIQCQQNSSIPLVLSFLQMGTPGKVQTPLSF